MAEQEEQTSSRMPAHHIPPRPLPQLTAGNTSLDIVSVTNPGRDANIYIVQYPKDQIYRVPPPENAKLVEIYRNQNKTIRRRNPFISFLKWFLGATLIIALLLGIIAVVIFAVAGPATPKFTIDRLSIKSSNSTKRSLAKTEYELAMSVTNPSRRMGFSYNTGGEAVVAYNGLEFAAGATPKFRQGHKNTTTIRIVLHELEESLPKSVEKSRKGSKDALRLVITAKFPVNPGVGGMELWKMSLEVSCDVKVIGLVKEAKISSQECKSNLHS
ncbi:hypothetical protein Cni_G02022 [Canna indica]|uniref:Late embryogenesis abundant protein LEA-2 subgroup domain-containing protein n=1 Tax=Canna indica TaxID=4628 RepID=A0AAQ3Q1R4_9LILI|nr:hypothetical protein Cni_G02022 [Canna indica]